MKKKAVYFFPGLGASPKIFEHISLSKDYFDIILLEWKLPTHQNEHLTDYVSRVCKDIVHNKPILIGVSFGGIIVQEIAKQINTEKVIIISSIKSHKELPTRLKLIRDTNAYKLFPTKLVENFEGYAKFFLGNYLKKRREIYKTYLSVRDPTYLKWAIYNVLHWKQENPNPKVIHIQGTEDEVFPVKNINNFIPVENGTHIMILTKSKLISTILRKYLTN